MAKKLIYIIIFLALSYGTAQSALLILEKYFDDHNSNTYFDSMGDENTDEKVRHLELQSRSARRNDNLFVFGSCELFDNDMNDLFLKKNNGFQVNKIGIFGSQSIIQAMNLGSLDSDISGRKAVFISSASWFRKEGIPDHYFEGNFSQAKYYSFMMNRKLSTSIKRRLAERISTISKDTKWGHSLDIYHAKLYASNFEPAVIVSSMFQPFYSIYFRALIVRDKYNAYKKIKNYRKTRIPEIVTPVPKHHDWKTLIQSAKEKDKKEAQNDLCLNNKYYKRNIENHDAFKKYETAKLNMPVDSPERIDFMIYLDVCKELNVKPLIINVPQHIRLTEYVDEMHGVNNRETQIEFNKWFADTVKSYKFDLADFSEEDCFNDRHSTIGRYGWAKINEAISRFYN